MAKKAKSGGKICAKGKAWAKRTFDTYPSAYANMAASKYCKDPIWMLWEIIFYECNERDENTKLQIQSLYRFLLHQLQSAP